MNRLTRIAAILIGYGISSIAWSENAATVVPVKSPAQAMLEQSAKVISASENEPVGSRPVVVAGKKPVLSAKSVVPGKEGRLAEAHAVASDAPPVKVLEGTGTSKTSLAKNPVPDPIVADEQSVRLAPAAVPPQAYSPQQVVSTSTPLPHTGLPGLGSPNSNSGTSKPIVVQAQNGVNEMVVVSFLMPNRIATPFGSPKVVDFSSNDYQVVGSDVFVVPKTKEPIGIFIKDSRPDSPTVALTLVPRAIPGVTVLVNLDGAYRSSGAKPASKNTEDGPDVSSHEDLMRKMMRQLALDKPMSGYTETPLDAGAAAIGPLRIIPEKQFSGTAYDIYRYRITNTGSESLELSEESFYQPGVKSIAFYPSMRLDPQQSSKVFILSGKEEGSE